MNCLYSTTFPALSSKRTFEIRLANPEIPAYSRTIAKFRDEIELKWPLTSTTGVDPGLIVMTALMSCAAQLLNDCKISRKLSKTGPNATKYFDIRYVSE